MKLFFLFVLIALAVLILVYLYRVVQGPTIYDRVLGLNGISTKAIILLVLIGTRLRTGRDVRGYLHGVRPVESGRGLGRCEIS